MAKKIKFALKMKDGVEVRNLQELRDNFDLNQVTAYFMDGKLVTWLSDRYYDEEAEQIESLQKDDSELQKKLCQIFGVEYEEDTMTPEEIEARNRKLAKLKEITDDEEILANVDHVAFSQEELSDLLDEGVDTIYLCGDDFVIPERVKDKTYIGINTRLNLDAKKMERYEKNNIRLINLQEKQEEADHTEAATQRQSELDVEAVVFCEGSSSSEHENFLMYVGKELEPYETESDEEDDEDYDEDEEEVDLEIQYQTLLKAVPTPDILKYRDARYWDKKIIYMAEDGQGEFLACMNVDGSQNRELRRWYMNEEELLWYCIGTEYTLVEYNKSDEEDYEDYYQRIHISGRVENIEKPEHNIFSYVAMPQGFYHINVFQDELQICELLNGETKEREYKIRVKLGEGIADYENELKAIYPEYETGKIYLFMGARGGYFYVFDTATRKAKLAVKNYIDYLGTFCVKGNQIVYFGDEWSDQKLMSLNMKSGKVTNLWEAVGKYGGIEIDTLNIVGDYVYLYKKNDSHGLYKTKLDGSQHTFVQGSQYKKTDIFLMSTQLSMRLLESLAGLTKSALPDAELNSNKDSEKEGNDLDNNYRKNFRKLLYIC